MTVYDLNRDQLEQVKQRMLMERYDERGESPSWGELAEADDIISDEEVYEEYGGTEFVPEDFGFEDEKYHLDIDCGGSKEDIASDLREIASAIENDYYSGLAAYGTSWGLDRD